jgi:hypothetical protein
MHKFEQVCTSLGVPIVNEKTKGPSTVTTFLGVEFDTINMELRLPSEQLQRIFSTILNHPSLICLWEFCDAVVLPM